MSTEPPNPILRDLLKASQVIVDVLPLSSGRSGAVSGEASYCFANLTPHFVPLTEPLLASQITIRPGALSQNIKLTVKTRKTALQYRLTDSGAVFFQKGTAGGVL